MGNEITKTVTCLSIALVLCGCEATIETPFAEPVGFNATPYCDVDRGAELVIPDAIKDVIAAETVDEDALANAVLVRSAMRMAHGSPSTEACQATFAAGDVTFRWQLSAAQDDHATRGGFDPAQDEDILAVQTDITRLWREDQAARHAMIGLRKLDETDTTKWAQSRAVAHGTRIDAMATTAIADYADRYGWIDTKRFGESVSAHAWILVQHADDHPEFQADILARMKSYVDRGETSLRNYAYLWDRVAVNTGQLQRYGTQPNWECDENGKMELRPLENPETVNERRAEMGLNTVEEGLASMEANVCG